MLVSGPAASAFGAASASGVERARVQYGPWILNIPRIGVNAQVVGLSAGHSREAPVPSLSAADEVGWWRFSARPGKPGNVVFVGHVDTYVGPAVFYNLYQLRPGDLIYVIAPPREPVRYRVRWVKEVRKGSLATRTILGRTWQHRAWLITCGGAFNYAARSYVDNIIVSAAQALRIPAVSRGLAGFLRPGAGPLTCLGWTRAGWAGGCPSHGCHAAGSPWRSPAARCSAAASRC